MSNYTFDANGREKSLDVRAVDAVCPHCGSGAEIYYRNNGIWRFRGTSCRAESVHGWRTAQAAANHAHSPHLWTVHCNGTPQREFGETLESWQTRRKLQQEFQ